MGGGAELYADNAAAMWAGLAPLSRVVPGPAAGLSVIEIAPQSAIRVILRRPLAADPGQIGDLVYWLATLPGHRGAGLGRAVMSAAIGACPHLPTTLVATAAGDPLYASLGFRPVAQAAWFRIPGPGR